MFHYNPQTPPLTTPNGKYASLFTKIFKLQKQGEYLEENIKTFKIIIILQVQKQNYCGGIRKPITI